MEPMHHLTATTISHLDGIVAFSARPHAPVLPVEPSRRERLRAVFARIGPARRRHGTATVRPAGVC